MKSHALREQSVDQDLSAWAVTSSVAEPADYCTTEGAQALKARIEAYWRDRGQHVAVALCDAGFHVAIRAVRIDIRSDMVNGMPRRYGKPAARVEDFDEVEDDLAYE